VFMKCFALPRGSLGTPSPRIDTKMTAPIRSKGIRIDVRIRFLLAGVEMYGPPGRRGVASTSGILSWMNGVGGPSGGESGEIIR